MNSFDIGVTLTLAGVTWPVLHKDTDEFPKWPLTKKEYPHETNPITTI